MSDKPNGFWGWALTEQADRNMLVFIVILCVLLGAAGLVFPSSGLPFISDIPFGAAVASFAAALVAVVATWPLRFLLRRRIGYYSGKDDSQ
jgi:cyanate permease